MGIQLQVSDLKKFKSDTHVIVRRLPDKQARGEPIMIENFVIDTINLKSDAVISYCMLLYHNRRMLYWVSGLRFNRQVHGVWARIFCGHLSYRFPFEVPCLHKELFLLKVLCFPGILTYSRQRKQSYFFVEFIQCYLRK